MSLQRIVTCFAVIAVCASMCGCAVRSRRPDGPYREAEELADALSDAAVACTRALSLEGSGELVIAAELTGVGKPPLIHDLGSLPGTQPVLECVRKHAADKLRCPAAAPAPFIRVRVPVPLVTSQVSYAFMQALPPLEAAPHAK